MTYSQQAAEWDTTARSDYWSRDLYELLRDYHRPRVETYLTHLRECLKKGTSIDQNFLESKYYSLAKDYYEKPLKQTGYRTSADLIPIVKEVLSETSVPQIEKVSSQWSIDSDSISDKMSHSGQRSYHNGRLETELAVNSPQETLGMECWVYPVAQSGRGKFTLRVVGLNSVGDEVGRISYVLLGKEDYWAEQNAKVNNRYFATVIINPEKGKWYHFQTKDITKDFDARFGKGTWASLGVVKYRISFFPWTPGQPGDTYDYYLDDVKVEQVVGDKVLKSHPCDFEKF